MATVTARGGEGLQVHIEAGGHTLLADEPASVGGMDAGPDPYALVLSGLAACTVMTLKMYAANKGWALDEVAVTLTFDRVHADDCANCEDDASGYIDQITTEVTITGDLDETQRKRLTQVAARCPVHKTLGKGVSFNDSVVFA